METEIYDQENNSHKNKVEVLNIIKPEISGKKINLGTVIIQHEKVILRVVKISAESETFTRVDTVGKYISVFNRDGVKHQDAVFSFLFKNGIHWIIGNEDNLRIAKTKEIIHLQNFIKKDFLTTKQYGSN